MKVFTINDKKFQAKRFLKILGFLLVLILINLSFLTIDYENDINNDFSNEINKNLKISGISEKIYINNNWSDAKAVGICTGSGTYTDPYVIKDLIIDAEGLGSCILIENSKEYFKIENCTVQNSENRITYNYPDIIIEAGIKLRNTTNGILITNNCSFNRYCGIYLEESNNNTIKENFAYQEGGNRLYLDHNSSNNNIINNTLYNNRMIISGINNYLSDNKIYENGITLSGNVTECASHIINTSNKVNGKPIYYYANEIGLEPINFTGAGQVILVNTSKSLISNLEIFNGSTGISLYYSYDNDIQKNNFSYNRYGISLYNSYNNIITENNLNNNFMGLYFFLNCDNNTIAMNNLTKNYYGLYLTECDNNTILRNNISNNDPYGIYCSSSTFNNFSYNIINFNGDYGIFLNRYNHNNSLMNNFLNSNKNYGIRITQSDSNLILQNSINNCEFAGIYLEGSRNNNLSGNLMFNCGLMISAYLIETHSIDRTNKVNNKTLYYYKNEIGLTTSNFTNAGQIILSNCNDSLISDIDVSYGTTGILLSSSNNNTIKNCISSFNNGYGIYLGACSKNIIITNNVNNNSLDGIKLSFSKNNKILNNNISYNGYFMRNSGIEIGYLCDNNSIIGNYLNYNNGHGIQMSWCENNNISNNILINCGLGLDDSSQYQYIDNTNKVNDKNLYFYTNEKNLKPNNFTNAGQIILINCNDSLISDINVSYGSSGITLISCINITLSDINSTFNKYWGLYLNGCFNCSILKNVLTNNWYAGIYISSSDNNVIKENDISSNIFGIDMYYCNKNTLSGNNINDNTIYGISIYGLSWNNTFHFNKFIENGKHVNGAGINCEWDDGKIGNYWDNYTGVDGNNDGIGDTPHFVFGDMYDNFPILDIISPEITILTPINEESYDSQAPEFSVKIKDPHLDKMWYTINEGATCIFFTTNGTIDQTLWDGVPEGNVTIRFFANDTIGNVNYQEVTIIKTTPQSNPPEIHGYNIFFLVGFLSVMVAIIIRKRGNFS